MSTVFDSIHNHHERSVMDAVLAAAPRFAHLNDPHILADVACVALNRLPPRYIRHDVDFSFYLTERERTDTERAITESVDFAFEFVQAKVVLRARR
ncbi:MAG: late competence development ComFB family protein [Pseudomonadota bacterium]|nr:late competence development ComFB family protein [Pseudomonadota bacterium]